jgi:hypothetical protein
VTTMQVWIILGVPLLVTSGGLLIGGSVVRTRWALVPLLLLALAFVILPGAGRVSTAAVGMLAMLLVAGGRLEGSTGPQHHEDRKRLTTATR